MSDVQSNICIINAENGVGTASPQITQFSSNCDCIKFIVKRDLSSCAVVVITSIDGAVNMVIEGESLSKTYDAETKETTLLWYPQTEVTCMSGCVMYQIAAYDTADDSKFTWYSKEGRLIVTDSIDTTDYSTALIASSPNLITQLITRSKATELALNSKVDKIDGMGLSSNDYTDEEKENLKSLVTDNQKNIENIDLNSRNISNLSNEFSAYSSSVHIGEKEYDSQSELSQSGKAVAQAIASIVNSAPGTLDTLQELAKALGDDPNFATTIMELLGNKVDKIDGMGLSTNDYNDLLNKPVIDLGTFLHTLNPDTLENEIDQSAEYESALNNARNTGVYKIMMNDLGMFVPSLLFVIGGTDSRGYEFATQLRLYNFNYEQDVMDSPEWISLPDMRKYYYDENSGEYIWSKWGNYDSCIFENTVNRKDTVDDSNKNASWFYPSVKAVYDFVMNTALTVDKVVHILDGNIVATQVPDINVVGDLINTAIHPMPQIEVGSTLKVNTPYNLGEVSELSLVFPTIADDGDVIYITFVSGMLPTALIINVTNTNDIEIVPEPNTGYEIFAKYNGSVWIVNYSEYTMFEAIEE